MAKHTFVTNSHAIGADETKTVNIVERKELDALLRELQKKDKVIEEGMREIKRVEEANSSVIAKLKTKLDAQSASELKAEKKLDQRLKKLESALSLYEKKWTSIGDQFQKAIRDQTWQNVVREVVRPQVEVLEQAKKVVVEEANYIRKQIKSLESLKNEIQTKLSQHTESLDQLLSAKLKSMHKGSFEVGHKTTEVGMAEKTLDAGTEGLKKKRVRVKKVSLVLN